MIYKNIIEKNNNIIAGTSIKTINNKNFDLSLNNNINENINNRKLLFNSLNIKIENTVFTNQIHSSKIAIITNNDKGKGSTNKNNSIPNCDAMITKEYNLTLCIMTADCLPIFIYDKITQTIAIAHAGWKGTKNKIIPKTIRKLNSYFNSNTKNIIISFGPGIGPCCYEVSNNFYENFPQSIHKKNNKLYLNLLKENYIQALSSGVKKYNILNSSFLCTACNNKLFYSYRKNKNETQRMLSFIAKTK